MTTKPYHSLLLQHVRELIIDLSQGRQREKADVEKAMKSIDIVDTALTGYITHITIETAHENLERN